MQGNEVSSVLKIRNIRGLHARAAAAFAKTAESYDADITVERIGQEVCGQSIMGLMMLGASIGTEIKVTCSGTQAQEALKALEKLVNDKFYED